MLAARVATRRNEGRPGSLGRCFYLLLDSTSSWGKNVLCSFRVQSPFVRQIEYGVPHSLLLPEGQLRLDPLQCREHLAHLVTAVFSMEGFLPQTAHTGWKFLIETIFYWKRLF